MENKFELKPLLSERMKMLLKEDFPLYLESLKEPPLKSIRCNTLKITPEQLKKRLEQKGWEILQPFKGFPEIMVIKSELKPGELGRSLEHLLGYYYIQEISSMLPPLVLEPKPGELVLDLCASPGSKTTQISAMMKNSGTIIANDVEISRIKILASNVERCGATNVIITKQNGSKLCMNLLKKRIFFDKILVDAPCSGEGTLRTNPKTYKMWNINMIKKLSSIQKNLLFYSIKILKPGGTLVYSTCTHAPEENEEVIDFVLKKYENEIKIERIDLPIMCKEGITNWNGKEYHTSVSKSCRIYPQDSNTEGFFISKIKKD
ncbi:MAG: NOL1/NOP2/sun family putative RNA methylase [Candidatus Pacearchaeota archaeon]